MQLVSQHAALTHAVNVVNATLTAIVLAPVDGFAQLIGWVVAITTVSAVRFVGARVFLRRRLLESGSSLRGWALFNMIGAGTTGVLWGIGAIILFPAEEPLQLFLAFVIGGMCAGAVTVNAVHLPTVLAFILPASLPLATRFLAQGVAGRVSALMILIFAVALSVISFAGHRMFGERIRLEDALDVEQRKLRETNARLTAEVTQRRTAEATLHQAQKMEAIGHLTGGIAHDFNNLLQVVIGNMDLIQHLGVDRPRIVKHAQAAEQAALRGAELTSSLLTFARRQTLDAEPISINALLREFEPILRRPLGAMVRFEIVLAPELPPCVADPAHFQSAVLNLVINACDAMPGGGAMSITTGMATLERADLVGNEDASPGRFVNVSVRDTGMGMSPEVMARVFEPFFTTKKVGKGTGLGLSQVYGFVRQSGGHIVLVSAPNEGTVATLWLPVLPASA